MQLVERLHIFLSTSELSLSVDVVDALNEWPGEVFVPTLAKD